MMSLWWQPKNTKQKCLCGGQLWQGYKMCHLGALVNNCEDDWFSIWKRQTSNKVHGDMRPGMRQVETSVVPMGVLAGGRQARQRQIHGHPPPLKNLGTEQAWNKELTRRGTIRNLDFWEHTVDLLLVASDCSDHAVWGHDSSCISGVGFCH